MSHIMGDNFAKEILFFLTLELDPVLEFAPVGERGSVWLVLNLLLLLRGEGGPIGLTLVTQKIIIDITCFLTCGEAVRS